MCVLKEEVDEQGCVSSARMLTGSIFEAALQAEQADLTCSPRYSNVFRENT